MTNGKIYKYDIFKKIMKNKRRLGIIVAGMICLSVLGTIAVRKAVIQIVSEYLKSRKE